MNDIVKKAKKFIYWINYGPIYYCSFFFGVLPFKCKSKHLYLNATFITEFAFERCLYGNCFVWLFVACNLYTGVGILKNSIDAVSKYNSCFDDICEINLCRNVCGHFTIVWINYLANLVSSLTILILRPANTLKCLNDGCRIYAMKLHAEEFLPAAWSVVLFLGVHVFSFTLHWKNTGYSLEFVYSYLPLHLTQCLPIVTENMISVLLLMMEKCYEDVNRKLREFEDRRYFLYNERESIGASLKYLKKYYWDITELAERSSACFGLDFFVAGVSSTVRFIYFLFLTLKYMADKEVINETGGLILPSYQSVVFFFAVVGKFYYLCYRCDRVVAEAKSVVPTLHTLQNNFRSTLETKNEQQVEEFLDYVECRDVSFSACGFFTLDLHLICAVFGLTLTYFLVLMQFQASH